VEKLHLISSCKLSVDNKAQTSHTEREDFTDEVQHIIQRIEEAKEKDYVIWYNKLQVCMCVCIMYKAVFQLVKMFKYRGFEILLSHTPCPTPFLDPFCTIMDYNNKDDVCLHSWIRSPDLFVLQIFVINLSISLEVFLNPFSLLI
jgi:calcineurin-like phosphoesterase family protein